MYHVNNQSPYCSCQRCPCCGKIVTQSPNNNWCNQVTAGGFGGGAGSVNCKQNDMGGKNDASEKGKE